ncbi:MAG: PorP/SprF family type IX secretion system membrane protein [Crocinitomicaceae bacterium]|nr:PorP/SprF family type IX secretion system membrane protein [Crocinitomicaceae bacterium]
MKTLFILIFGVSLSSTSLAQDIHFTMFHAAPTALNPACAGVFDGTFRASTNFKTQWGTVSNAYNTFSLTADGSFFKNKGGTAHLGIGLNMYRDVAGATKFGTTKMDLSLSAIIFLDEKNTGSVGLSGGWGQRTISPENLQWDSQYEDGTGYNGMLPSNESLSFENSNYFDFSAGVLWNHGTAASNIASFDKFRSQVGFAYHHIARPKINNYTLEEKKYSKFVIHADLHFSQENSRMAFRPRISAFFQGPSRELNIGMMFRYLIKEGSKFTGNVKGFAISAGAYYRVADAISPSIEIELAGFSLGYSYDFNTSGLRAASNGLGGHEIYLKFQNPNPFFRFSRRPSIR